MLISGPLGGNQRLEDLEGGFAIGAGVGPGVLSQPLGAMVGGMKVAGQPLRGRRNPSLPLFGPVALDRRELPLGRGHHHAEERQDGCEPSPAPARDRASSAKLATSMMPIAPTQIQAGRRNHSAAAPVAVSTTITHDHAR